MGQSNTPGHDGIDLSVPMDITIVDPRHPLYGRRFRLWETTRGLRTDGHALVVYRPGILLKLPITVTSLVPFQGSETVPTKLSVDGLCDLIDVAGTSEDVWPSSPPKFGTACRQHCVGRSALNSPPSSVR